MMLAFASPVLALFFAQAMGKHPPDPQPKMQELSRLTAKASPSGARAVVEAIPEKNFIDKFIFERMKRDNIPHAGLSSDPEFFRRIHLDLTGRLPEPAAIRKFVEDKDAAKRDKLIEELMATKFGLQLQKIQTPFLDRWAYFFGELLRNGTAQQGMGRNVFHDYLYDALMLKVPYDQLVTEMITAKTRSNWQDGPSNLLVRDHVDGAKDLEGVNNEDGFDEMAITTSRLFLGINLECVSCHDGKGHLEKINTGLANLKRVEMWRQAAFFGKTRVYRPYSISQEFAVQDDYPGYDLKSKSVVRMQRYKADIAPRFILTGEQPKPGENWRAAYARMLTSHPQFARATVNLIWAELMGVGIVDPPLDFDLAKQDTQPSNPELLDALAKDFSDHKFDLRYLIHTIVSSNTYQLSSRFNGEWKDSYAPYFARHFIRRLSPEMICDAIQSSTDVFDEIPIAGTSIKVQRVMQTRSPEDLGGPKLRPMVHLLTSFGQNNRDKGEKETTGSTVQASVLLNSPFVKDRIKPGTQNRISKLLQSDPPMSNEAMVDEMFLAFLSRWPNAAEKKTAIESLEKYHGQGLEDLAWGLINKVEFVFNY